MKKIIFIFVLGVLLGREKEQRTRNPYLGEFHFAYTIDTNPLLYNSLKTPMNTVFVPYGGIKDFFMTYSDSSYYTWEVACLNHTTNTCERLHCASKPGGGNTFERCDDANTHSFIFIQCPYGGTVYNLVNGNPAAIDRMTSPYCLLYYNVSVAGNILTISN